jgi:ribosomal protein S18 acetylase RimI-like enzyme
MSAVPASELRAGSGPSRLRAAPPPAICVRRAQAADYAQVAEQVDRWSRGRFVGAALPRSFFQHFADTSLLLLEADRVAGVMVGFRSQAQPAVACVHFVAIAPASRRQGRGRRLYEAFFARARELGCDEVHTVVPPVNSSLIAFHRQLGFEVVDGGGFHCGIAVAPDFAGPGQHRVLFRKHLAGWG